MPPKRKIKSDEFIDDSDDPDYTGVSKTSRYACIYSKYAGLSG